MARELNCYGLTADDFVLTDNVLIKGASSSKPSRLIIRDSELPELDDLIDPAGDSVDFSESRLKNWVFNGGLQPDVA